MAFEHLVYRYDRQVLSIANSYTHDLDDAKDIYQDVFLRVFRSLPAFEGRSGFSTWLYRIVTNACLSHVTRARKHRHEPIEAELGGEGAGRGEVLATGQAASLEQELARRHLTRRLERGIESLSPQQKLVLILRHYQGFKLREIAQMMNCAEGTVKKHLFTAMTRLRAQVGATRDEANR